MGLADLWHAQRRPLIALVLGLLPFWIFVGSSNSVKVNGEVVSESSFNVAGVVMGIAGIATAISALREDRSRLRVVLCVLALLVCAGQIAWSAELVTRKTWYDVVGWPLPDPPESDGLSYAAQRQVRGDAVRQSKGELQQAIIDGYGALRSRFAEHKRYADACHRGTLRADDSSLMPPVVLGQAVIAAIAEAEAKTFASTKTVPCSESNSRRMMVALVERMFAKRDELAIQVSAWRRRFAPAAGPGPALHPLAGDPLLAAAEQGSMMAQLYLSEAYYEGDGIEEDKAQAVAWWRKAAEQGSIAAYHNLGMVYDDGESVAQDSAQAADWFRKAAERGHSGSQFRLAILYEKGRGVPQDDAEAARWYRRCIARVGTGEEVLAEAQVSLGRLIEQGRGEPRDVVLAALLYRLAGNSRAGKDNLIRVTPTLSPAQAEEARTLANAWRRGMPLPTETKTGRRDMEALHHRAEQGDAEAQFELAMAYDLGQGVAKDRAQALAWYRKAAEQGHATAQVALGDAYAMGIDVPRDDTVSTEWYRKAAEQGQVSGQYWLGEAYASGTGVASDVAVAVQWYRKSAEQGDSRAFRRLMRHYADGKGVPRDYVLAAMMARLARSGERVDGLSPDQDAEAAALAAAWKPGTPLPVDSKTGR